MYKTVSVALLLVISAGAGAETTQNDKIKWQSDAELGLIITNGNSTARNVSTKLNLLNERPRWRHQAKAEGLKASDKQGTTAEKYLANAKTNYKFSKNNYIYLMLNYEDDRFSGYEYQASESLGYGHRFQPASSAIIDLELGVGARQSRIDDTGEYVDEGTGRVATMLEWKISPTSVFKEEASLEFGEDNTVSRSVTSLKAKVSEDLSMKLSFSVRRNSTVPAGVRNTDTETAVTLVYNLL